MSRTYEQLEPVISALDERIKTGLGAFPTDTAEGSIASFPDGADDIPLKSLVVDINPVQSGSGDPSPDNVRPISGHTQAVVTRTGKNLFPYKDIESQTKNGVTITIEKSNGAITNIHMQGTATTAFPVPLCVNDEDNQWVLPKGEYKLYIGGDKPTQIRTFDINVRKANTTSDISASSGVTTITLSEQTTFGSAYIWIYSGTVLNNNIIPVIVPSGVDTSVKYPITQRQSITIDLGQTVYGGHLDVLSGELVIDRAMVDLGTLTWNYVASTPFNFRASELIGAKIPETAVVKPNAICSILPVLDYTAISAPVDGITIIFASSAQAGKVWAHSGTYIDATAFKSAVTGQTFVYELAEPITIQLTPNQVNSLLGVNNIFADTGDCTVEYRADTKMYIERLTAPDADMIADANIVSGSYFMVGNTLYKATANIASGSAVIVGTNCTQKSLSEALNEINQ